jgi:Ca2+-binding EF-hand superfamily protein
MSAKINIPMGAPGGGPPPLSKRMFDKYDKDGSGSIDAGEFKGLVYDLGHSLNANEHQMAMKMLDEKGTGQIEYNAFKKWWADKDRFEKLKLDEKEEAILQQAVAHFKYFDKDLSGTIDKNELKLLHADLVKNKMTSFSLDDTQRDLDSNNDGVISFNEYVDWLIRKNVLKVKVLG